MWWLISTAAAMELSYDDALRRALERNPALVGAQYDVESAEGQLMGSRGIYDPVLEGRAGHEEGYIFEDVTLAPILGNRTIYQASLYQLFPTGTQATLLWDVERTDFENVGEDLGTWDQELSISIVQPLLQGVLTHYNLAPVRQASRYVDVQTAVLAQQREQSLADTAIAYWGLYYRRRAAQIAQAAIDVAQEEQRVVHARVDAGDLAPVERSRVDALVVQAQSAFVTAQNEAQTSNDQLLIVIGEPLGDTVELTTEPGSISDTALDEAAVVADALANNPEVAASRINEESAALDLRDARHARLPELNALGSFGYEAQNVRTFGGAAETVVGGEFPLWSIGGELTVPLLDRADRGVFGDKQAVAAKARIEREAIERSIDQQVRAQVRTVSSAKLSVTLAEANLRFAEETLTAQRALQNAGRAIQKDVLEAIRDVDEARVEVVRARADAALALVELNRLRGAL
jgi:outer membrane protein TolC